MSCQACEEEATCDFATETFRCSTCDRDVPLCMGATVADAQPICDDCWWEAEQLGKVCPSCARQFTAEDLVVHKRIRDNARKHGRDFEPKLCAVCLWRAICELE